MERQILDLEVLIHNEHEALLTSLDQRLQHCKANPSEKAWIDLIDFCETYFEKNHHAKEEKFIFASVRGDERIRMGGPLCTLYYDQYLMTPPIARAQRLSKQFLGQAIEPDWGSDFDYDIKHNTPLLIPGGDHVAGRMILKIARSHLKNTYTEQTSVILGQLFFHYRDIQQDHFVREENCFLKMCRSLLGEQRWQEINQSLQSEFINLDLSIMSTAAIF